MDIASGLQLLLSIALVGNVAACRFYVRQGCTLGAVNRLAYPNLPNEIQMLWYKDLVSLDE